MTVLKLFLKGAGALLAFTCCVAAQLPGVTVHVGVKLRTQYGGLANAQRVSVVAEAGHTLPDIGLGRRARIGGTMYAYSAGFDNTQVATFLPPLDITHWFSLCWMDSLVHPLWIAEPGHNWIFGSPDYLMIPSFSFEWLGPSPWDYEQIANSPPEGWQAYFLRIPIPNVPQLNGSAVSVQSYRYDSSQKFYVSDEAMFVIG